MNNVIDEVLAGEPRYNIKTDGGSSIYNNVQIDLATTVTTSGTPLNKALFDSIQADLNTRLLISNKATTAEAQAGTNDTKYMTPLKTQQKLNSLTTVIEGQTNDTTTLISWTASDKKVFRLSGKLRRGQSGLAFLLNNTSVFSTRDDSSSSAWYFVDMTIDLNTLTYYGRRQTGSSAVADFYGTFSSGAGSLVIDPNGTGNPAPSWSISIVANY